MPLTFRIEPVKGSDETLVHFVTDSYKYRCGACEEDFDIKAPGFKTDHIVEHAKTHGATLLKLVDVVEIPLKEEFLNGTLD